MSAGAGDSVAAYAPDLLDRSKIAGAVPGCRFVSSPDALVGLAGVDTVIVDLSKRGVLDVLPALVQSGARVVAYGRHTSKDLLAAAKDAGVTDVLVRRQFFANIADHVLRA